jgi:multimeric flavodoxin WrbA
VYHTQTGHTGSLAQAVTEGAQRADNVQVNAFQLTADQLGDDGRWSDESVMAALDASDAIIFGSPTYMGSVSSVCKAFMEATLHVWASQGWKDKFAGGFTNSAGLSGDKLNSLFDLVVFASQLGMNWVSVGDLPGTPGGSDGSLTLNRLGAYLGVISQSDLGADPGDAPPAMDLETGRSYGERVARIAQHFKGEGTYDTTRIPFSA